MICIDARDFVSGPILEGNGQVRRRELLSKLWRERIKLRGVVVGNDAREVSRRMGRREKVELRQRGGLVIKLNFLAIAKIAGRSGKRRHFR